MYGKLLHKSAQTGQKVEKTAKNSGFSGILARFYAGLCRLCGFLSGKKRVCWKENENGEIKMCLKFDVL
jgi:hypothetical protein